MKLGPQLPDQDKLVLEGFLTNHSAVESDTDNRVNIILTAQLAENDKLPVILDIETFKLGNAEPEDWAGTLSKVQSLRRLKNLVFDNSLSDQCLNLFQQ